MLGQTGRRGFGFTLIELLVAMAVMAVLVVLLFGMVDSATKLWRENENRVDSYREARAALAVMTSDLRSILVSTNESFFSTNVLGSNPTGATNGLFFLSSLPLAAQPPNNRGGLCTVGYFRGWEKQTAYFGGASSGDKISREAFHVFRSVYGSDLTYSNLNQALPTPLVNLAAANVPEVLARNICSLEFLCYVTNSAGTYKRWVYKPEEPLPQMIEIRMVAINDETAKALDGEKSRWTTNDPLVAKNMRTFVSRVEIPRFNP
jgi:prepilin-type N-terminal cleavage/methylation domain-containing protein